MSFKDLEQQLQQMVDQWSADEQAKIDAKAQKKLAKALKKAKAGRPPMFRPDKPLKYTYSVSMVVRDISHRVWGDEMETTYTVSDTISKVAAELEATKQANKDGLAVIEIIGSTLRTE